jgi:HD superfamily phosphohydrolase
MIDTLESIVDRWVNESLEGYIPRLYKKKKIIKDPIWNMIELSELECSILDTPVLQRLRRIHQTGLAYFTYPAALHTRFEHTLGVVAATSKVAKRLSFCPDLRGLSITQRDFEELRLAALLHDVGHCALSHLSEPHFGNHVIFKIYAEKFRKETGLRVKPHELLGYCVVKTPSFEAQFEELVKSSSGTHKINNPKTSLGRIADMIVGFSPEGSRPHLYLSNIINGAFDADKIDYIARDSYFTGIALGAEVEMLMHKLLVHPSTITDGISGENVPANCIIVNYSGGVAYEQIAMSKKSLNVNVYNHQKVMAAHELARDLINMVLKGEMDIHGQKYDNPSLLLGITDWDLLAGSTKSKKGVALQKKIAGRILPRRALKIAEHTLEEKNERGLRHFFNKVNEDEKHGKDDFRGAVADLAKVNKEEVFLAVPDVPTTRELMEGKCQFPDGKIEDIGNHFAGAVESYGLRREISYVFALKDIKKVGEAAKAVLRSSEYGALSFTEGATACLE